MNFFDNTGIASLEQVEDSGAAAGGINTLANAAQNQSQGQANTQNPNAARDALAQQIMQTWGKFSKEWTPRRAEDFAISLLNQGINNLDAFNNASFVNVPYAYEVTFNPNIGYSGEGGQGGYSERELGRAGGDYALPEATPLYDEYGVPLRDEQGNIRYSHTYSIVNRDVPRLSLGDKDYGYFTVNDARALEGLQSGIRPTNDPNVFELGWSTWGHEDSGKGHTKYYGVKLPDGRFVTVPVWGSSSDAANIRQALVTAASMYLTGGALGAYTVPASLSTAGQVIGAANAIRTGDVLGGAASLAGLGGFSNVSAGLNLAKAVENKDPFGVITAGMNLAGVQGIDVGGLDLNSKDILNVGRIISAVSNDNPAAALTALGSLIDSPNTSLAGAALNFKNALESGDIGKITGAAQSFNSALGKSSFGSGSSEGSNTGTRSMSSSSGYTGDATAVGYDPEYYSNSDTTDYDALHNEPSYMPVEWYDDPIQQIDRASPGDYGTQDLGIAPENQVSNFYSNPDSTFSSGWQTVGSDRIMVNDDGTAIGINTETNETYSLTPDEVQQMIDNKMLNTSTSGYTAATTGKTGTQQQSKTGTQQQSKTSTQQQQQPGQQTDPLDQFLKMMALSKMFDNDDESKTPYQVADIDVESPFGRYV